MQIFRDSDLNQILEVKEPITVKDIPYWTAELYGFGKYIRQYGYYPKQWPLMVFTDHSGPHAINRFNQFEINATSSVVMFHSPELVKKWKSNYPKPCYNLYSPFVFYRRKNKIKILADAKGTIAYPAHSIPDLEDISNIEAYIAELRDLPEKYQPVSVSLHYHDLNKGLHKIFLHHGIDVYTAGNPNDYLFTERFYGILKNFRYATSNLIGSYLFYAVEMGIPFFLYGSQPIYKKRIESHLATEALESVTTRDERLTLFLKVFEQATDEVTAEQRELVESTLGLYNGISRFTMSRILYHCFAKHVLSNIIMKSKTFLKGKLIGSSS